MTTSWPLNSTDPTCPVSSESFWDNDGNIVDNSHNHNNIYYTKDEIEAKLENLSNESKPISLLSSGTGIQFFEFNGTTPTQIHVDFEQSQLSPTIGVSTKAARSDHSHANLMSGIGIKNFVYNGSSEQIVSLDFTANGSSTSPAREDHAHKVLTAGTGLVSNTYDGTAARIFAVDFGYDSDSLYGSENYAARRNHYHNDLIAGNGLMYKVYNGSEETEFSLEYEGFGSTYGQNVSVARSDHNHDTSYLAINTFNTNAVVRIDTIDKHIKSFNTNGDVLDQFQVDYAIEASKLETERRITLSGNVTGYAIFDGTDDIEINTKVETWEATEEVTNTIKTIIGTWLESAQSKYIQTTFDNDTFLLSQKIIASDKLETPLSLEYIGDVSGNVQFDGSENEIDVQLDISSDGRHTVKSIVSEMFSYSNVKDIIISYDQDNEMLSFDIPNIYKSDRNIIPNQSSTYSVGSQSYKFSTGYIDNIYATYIKTDQLDVDSVRYAERAGGTKFSVYYLDSEYEFDTDASEISYRDHKHINSDIQPNLIRVAGKITSEIRPYVAELDWTGMTNINSIEDFEQYYPTSLDFFIYNRAHDNVDYNIKWYASFDTKNMVTLPLSAESDEITVDNVLLMQLSDEGNLWVKNDLTVDGNLTVKGTSFTVNSETVSITDNYFILNSADTGQGVSRGEAGIIIKRGTSEDYYIRFNETTDNLYIGLSSNLNKVPTIQESITNNSLLSWNNNLITASGLIFNNNTLTFSSSDTLKVNGNKLYFNDIQILTSTDTANSYYTKTQVDAFFEGTSGGKKTVNWNNITNKPSNFPAVITDSVSTTSSTTAASATAVKTAYDLAATKANASHTHSVTDITDAGTAAGMNIIVSSSAPPSSGGDFDIWFHHAS